MIILIQPMYSKQELNADSNYVIYTQWVKAISALRPDWRFVIIFPDAASGFKYADDGFFSRKDVIRLPQRISPRKQANAITYDASWYDMLFRKFAFDAIWCNLVEIGSHLKYGGASCYTDDGRPLVINAHNYVIHETLPYPIEAQKNVLLAQLMGGLCADINVFNSDHCQSMFRDNIARWLSKESAKEIEGKSIRIDYGPLDGGIFDHDPIDKDIPIIAYNHRLQSYKQWKITFQILDDLYREGIKFKLRYMNNTSEKIAQIKHFPWVETRLCRDRKEYLDALRGCDLNVTNSLHETFCIAAIESMAMGQPLIAPQGITFPQITGQKSGNGYPLLFKNLDEQKNILRKVLKDQDYRRKWGQIAKKHVALYKHERWAEQYIDLIERNAKALMDFKTKPEIEHAAKKILKEEGKIEINDFFNKMNKIRIGGKQSISNQSFPLIKILRLARKVGGKSTIEGGKQWLYF